MSVTFKIDIKTGEILAESHFLSDLRGIQGTIVTPSSFLEERRIRKISENAKKVRLLKEQIAGLDLLENLEALETERRRRVSLARQVQELENFALASTTVTRLKQRMTELELVAISYSSDQGREEAEVRLDDYTDDGLSDLQKQLEHISNRFESEEQTQTVMQELISLETQLEELPARAKETFFRLMIRLELAQSIIDRLYASGWEVELEAEGDARTATRINACNPAGDRAVIVCGCDDQFILETPGFSESARSALQQLVMGTLHDSGADRATGHCSDRSPGQMPIVIPKEEALCREAQKERMFR